MELKERIEILKEIGGKILSRKEELIDSFARDIGVAVKIGSAEVEMTAGYLSTMEEEAEWVKNRSPYGVVGAVLPYDAPTMMFARIAGSAVIGGNSVRISFSSLTPSTRDIVAEITGNIPQIEINTDMDNRSFSDYCTKSRTVKAFFISGGKEVGRLFERRMESFEKLIFAGPGGMPPCLVLEDADPEKAAEFTAKRAFLNGGQYCTTIKRALVHERVFDEFMHHLLERVDRIKVGDPYEPDTDYGPIKAKRTVVLVERALRKIKGVYLRGGRIEGEFIPPTVVITQEIPDLEMFGPFLAVKKFKSNAGIVEEALKTRYPFIIYVFGGVSEREKRAIKETYGMHHFNPRFTFLPLRGAFGGKKESGWILERENGCVKKRDGAVIYSVELTKPG